MLTSGKRKKFLYALLFLVFCLSPIKIQSQNKIQSVLESSDLKFTIYQDSTIYEKGHDFHDIARSIFDGTSGFSFEEASSKNYTSKGYTKDNIWVLIDLFNNTNKEEFIVNLNNSHLDMGEVFLESKSSTSFIIGDNLVFSEWIIPEIKISFPVQISNGERERILLRINTTSAVNLKPALQEPKEFYKSIANIKLLFGLFYGSVAIMIIYNFVIYLIIKENLYLFYSAVILSNLIVQMFLNGTDLYWMGYFPAQRNILSVVYIGFSAFLGVKFLREFLGTSQTMTHLDSKLKISSYFFLLVSFLSYLTLELRWSIIVANLIGQVFSLLILAVIIRGIFMNIRGAKLFLVAWGFLLLGIMLFSLLELGIVPLNFFTEYANQIGSTMEATILSLAMAERLRKLKREKEEAQEKAFQNLEVVVQERTKQLNKTLSEIQKDIQMARRIQTDPLPQKSKPTDEIKFFRSFQPLNIIGGDTFDLEKIGDGFFRIFLADATGHGVQAALVTMAIRAEYHSLKRTAKLPSEILHHLNVSFIREYYSLNIIYSCCVLDIDTINRKIYFSSAGHPEQILIQNNNPILMEKTGRIIGLSESSAYTTREYDFNLQDRVFLFSDGILEQINNQNEEYGINRLMNYLQKNHSLELDSLLDQLKKDFEIHKNEIPLQDDFTVLGIEINSQALSPSLLSEQSSRPE